MIVCIVLVASSLLLVTACVLWRGRTRPHPAPARRPSRLAMVLAMAMDGTPAQQQQQQQQQQGSSAQSAAANSYVVLLVGPRPLLPRQPQPHEQQQAAHKLAPADVMALPLVKYQRQSCSECTSSQVDGGGAGPPEGERQRNRDGDCPVCLADFRDGEMVRMLPDCLHLFHPACIGTWLLAQPSCPICRLPVQVSEAWRRRGVSAPGPGS